MTSRGLAWPDGSHLRHAARRAAGFTLLFGAAYGATDWIAGLHAWRVPVHLALERSIPLVPGAAWPYTSLYLLLALLPFALREREELDAFVRELRWILAVACALFLLVPAEVAHAPAVAPGASGALLAFADRLNLDHNLVPSLHVALAVASARVVAGRLRIAGAVLAWLWALSIAAATVLTHQHHLLDVVAGAALALLAPRLARTGGGPRGGRQRGRMELEPWLAASRAGAPAEASKSSARFERTASAKRASCTSGRR
jgi:membrane-associated phospholipid phosphatase